MAPKKHQHGTSAAESGGTKVRGPAPSSRWTEPITIFTGLVALFTLILVGVSGLQAWAFIESERASLALAGISLEGGKLTAGPVVARIQITNSGKQTAFVVAVATTTTMRVEPLEEVPQYMSGPNTIRGPIPAGFTYSGRMAALVDGKPFSTTPEQVSEINSGARRIYFYGRIEYDDAFSFLFSNRVMGFCGLYNPKGDPSVSMFDDCGNPKYQYAR